MKLSKKDIGTQFALYPTGNIARSSVASPEIKIATLTEMKTKKGVFEIFPKEGFRPSTVSFSVYENQNSPAMVHVDAGYNSGYLVFPDKDACEKHIQREQDVVYIREQLIPRNCGHIPSDIIIEFANKLRRHNEA